MPTALDENKLRHLLEQGHACAELNKHQQALLYFTKTALSAPDHIEALVACAQTLLNLNRAAEAAIYSVRALQLHLTSNILSLHAQVLYQMGEYAQALECFEDVIADQPHHYIALTQCALCLTQVNRYDEARDLYQQAVASGPSHDPWIYYNYSLCLLTMGHLVRGFELFEYRWQSILAAQSRAWVWPPSTALLRGKSILIHAEQGLGDSIQFFRYIPLLVSLGAQVFLEIQTTLIPLFSSWRQSIRLIAYGSPLPLCDYHCPLMSLARLFKTDMVRIPQSIPYVFPDITSVDACKNKLGQTTRHRIGIAWKGSALNTMNQKRSINLPVLLSLYQAHSEWICLQKEVSWEEKKVLLQYQIDYHGLELSTLEGTAALISCLDLVITIDTSIAHLAAAMGKDVWILLPFSADWRWFLQREDSPWYPNVTLFRQETQGDWRIPLNRIHDRLKKLPTLNGQNALEELMRQADATFQNGLFFEAEQRYRQILIKNPECHRASLQIALAALQQNKMADAIQFMQQATEIAPTMGLYHRNLSELLRRVGQIDAAIAILSTLIHREPGACENHFLCALSYHDHHQFELAIEHYRLALSLDPKHGLAWNNLGATLESQGHKDQAKFAYCEAIRLNPNHAEAQNNLGALYSEEGLLDKARHCYEAAITSNPEFIEAHYNLSQIKTYLAEDPHLVWLETFEPKIHQYSIRTRIHYYFALGKALDDTQQYARAFKAYAQGNQLNYLQNPWDKTNLQNLVDDLPKVFTRTFFKPRKYTPTTPCPIFIVGMPRAGTTLIEQILASHHSIYGAGELSLLDDLIQDACRTAGMPFNTWVSQLTDDEFQILGEKYLEQTAVLAPDKAFIIDKMPSNCFYLGIISRMLPNAKIIHAIRDPMDSCFSCYTHLFKSGLLFSYDLLSLGDYYALYAKAMQHWQSVLPPGTIFNLPYEQMIEHHEALSKQLVAYIGLPWDPHCLNFYNHDRPVKTASLTQVRKPIYKTSVQRWQYFADELQTLLQILTPYRAIQVMSV